MQVICLQEEAFYTLVDKVIQHVEDRKDDNRRWIDGEEAMAHLSIKSKSTLQKLRDEGRIRYSQPQKKIILYDRDSLDAYLEKNAKDTF
ncbi:helix-turn-helix domain-containing protein [Ekhidna sp.]|jgi:hypothetical protein|uniref:helix-turn-helix domain-containing protein n=1 Tax=Ekhidna sp. TaxID=2608089 RepID=UPI0032ECC838